MQITATEIPDVLILRPHVYEDERGFFFESYNQRVFNGIVGRDVAFVQDNHSKSVQYTLRGLHYQEKHIQGKLVRPLSGIIYDVAVDLRKNSPSFGSHVGIILDSKEKQMLWVPEGFAHGFLALSETVELLYKTSNFYDPQSEKTLKWNDPDLAIAWPLKGNKPKLSPKDQNGVNLSAIKPLS